MVVVKLDVDTEAYCLSGVPSKRRQTITATNYNGDSQNGHCKRYRAGVDVDVTPPTGGPVGHPPNPATLCDRSAQGSKS